MRGAKCFFAAGPSPLMGKGQAQSPVESNCWNRTGGAAPTICPALLAQPARWPSRPPACLAGERVVFQPRSATFQSGVGEHVREVLEAALHTHSCLSEGDWVEVAGPEGATYDLRVRELHPAAQVGRGTDQRLCVGVSAKSILGQTASWGALRHALAGPTLVHRAASCSHECLLAQLKVPG